MKEVFCILDDILTGELPLIEFPGFLAWLVKILLIKGHANG